MCPARSSRRPRRRVVRRLEVVTGKPPADGTRAELDLVAFPDDPKIALGPEVSEVTYSSPRGRFPAWFVRGNGPDQKTWAILVHGKGGSRMEMFRMTRATRAAGMPSLDITYRNDEGGPLDPSGYYQYGLTEWRDLRGAVAYATAHGAERVVFGADSMGGGIVASYLRHQAKGETGSKTGPEVVGLVLDAPMLDFGETVTFGARKLHVPGIVTWTAKRIAAARYDIDWDALDYLSDNSWLRVPALVFHGTADIDCSDRNQPRARQGQARPGHPGRDRRCGACALVERRSGGVRRGDRQLRRAPG